MASYSGGDVTNVVVNHQTLGMTSYSPKGGEDCMIAQGGPVANDDDNAITSKGEPIDQLNFQRGSITVTLACSPGDGVLASLQAHQSSPIKGVWQVTNINGSVHRIVGKPVGRLEANANTSTIQVKISGGVVQTV
jgi:hypothetical protein